MSGLAWLLLVMMLGDDGLLGYGRLPGLDRHTLGDDVDLVDLGLTRWLADGDLYGWSGRSLWFQRHCRQGKK